MTKMIINADDFGMTKSVNQGIIKAHKDGVLTSTTVMVNMPFAEEAIHYSKENPKLGFGVHLNLTQGKPLCQDVPSLIAEHGEFKDVRDLYQNFDLNPEEVYKEFKSQIDTYISWGLYPTHLDSHHHIHRVPELKDVLKRLQDEYKVPYRNIFSYENRELKTHGYFDSGFYDKTVSFEYFVTNKDKILSQDIIELMCHPAIVDEELMEITIYNTKRGDELAILTSDEMRRFIEENNVELINFSDLKE